MSGEWDVMSPEEMEAVAAFLIRELESTEKRQGFGESFEASEQRPQPYQDEYYDYEPESYDSPEKELIREVVREMYGEKDIIREVVQEVYAEKASDGLLSGMTSSEMEFLTPFLPQAEGGYEMKRKKISDSTADSALEKWQQALPEYSETAHESGVDMGRVSSYFDRDSRRYDSAFERY